MLWVRHLSSHSQPALSVAPPVTPLLAQTVSCTICFPCHQLHHHLCHLSPTLSVVLPVGRGLCCLTQHITWAVGHAIYHSTHCPLLSCVGFCMQILVSQKESRCN